MKKLDKHIQEAIFEVQPTADFVDRVMKQIVPPRFVWLRPYALGLTLFTVLVIAMPPTRSAILNEMYPRRAVAANVDSELDEITQLMDELRHDFGEQDLSDVSQ